MSDEWKRHASAAEHHLAAAQHNQGLTNEERLKHLYAALSHAERAIGELENGKRDE